MLDCAAKGVHGLVVISSGFAETGEEGRQRQRRLVGLARTYGLRLIGPNCLGIINTDAGRLAERLPVAADAAARPGRVLLPVRRAGLGDPREGRQPRPGPLDVRQRRQPRRRLRQRPAAVLGGGRRHRGRAALPRVDRQPAQVLPHRPPGLAAQADHRGPVRPLHPGRADGPRGPLDRRPRRPPSTRCSGRPGSSRSTPSTRCSTSPSCSPTSRCRAGRRVAVVGNSDALGPAGRRRRRRGRAAWSASRSRWAPTPPPRTSRTPSTPPSTTPRSTRSSRSTSRRSTPRGEEVANVLAAVGEQSDKPLVSTFLGAEGVPELLRVPDVAGSTAGRGSVPSYPAVEAAVRALARVVEYAAWLRTPHERGSATPTRSTSAGAKRLRRHDPDGGARGPRPGVRPSCSSCSAAYGIDLWEPHRVGDRGGGGGGGRRARLGRRAQGDRRAPAPPAGPGPRVAQHRRTPRRCARVGDASSGLIDDARERRLRRAEGGPAGRARRDRRHRGPAVRAGRCRSASPGR